MFDAIVSAVSLTDAVVAMGAIAAVVALLRVAKTGARTVLSMIKP